MYKIWKVKRPLERPRHRQAAGNINIDLKETVLKGMECIHLDQDTYKWLGLCEHGNELTGSTQ